MPIKKLFPNDLYYDQFDLVPIFFKKCKKCKNIKEDSNFRSKISHICIKWIKTIKKETRKIYNEKNIERIKKSRKKYYMENIDDIKKYSKEYKKRRSDLIRLDRKLKGVRIQKKENKSEYDIAFLQKLIVEDELPDIKMRIYRVSETRIK